MRINTGIIIIFIVFILVVLIFNARDILNFITGKVTKTELYKGFYVLDKKGNVYVTGNAVKNPIASYGASRKLINLN